MQISAEFCRKNMEMTIYDNVPNHQRAEARRCVMGYFSCGCGPYCRYYHGDNKLTPRQQQDIMDILASIALTLW